MARPRSAQRITGTYSIGYAVNRDGVIYTHVGTDRRTTYLRWDKANFTEARRILDMRCKEYLDQGGPANPVPSLSGAFTKYATAMFGDMSRSARRDIRQACSKFLVDDIAMDYNALADMIVERNAALQETHAVNTRRKMLQRVQAFFSYAIERGWLLRNPVGAVKIPTEERKVVDVYSPFEVDAIVSWHDANPPVDGRPEQFRKQTAWLYARYFELLSLTALRPSEALALKVSDVTERAFRIEGKRAPGVAEVRVRWFPLVLPTDGDDTRRETIDAWLERVRVIIAELTARAPDSGELFPWRNSQTMNNALQRAKQRATDPTGKPVFQADDGRTVKTFRETAIWYWTNYLGIDRETRVGLAGHTKDVAINYYEKERTADELAAAMLRPAKI